MQWEPGYYREVVISTAVEANTSDRLRALFVQATLYSIALNGPQFKAAIWRIALGNSHSTFDFNIATMVRIFYLILGPIIKPSFRTA